MEININTQVVAEHGQLISQIGSNLGKPFYRVEQDAAWRGGNEGFERDKAKIVSGESGGFILNKSPMRYRIKSFLIQNHAIIKDDDLGYGIAVNLRADGSYDLFLPLDNESVKAGLFTAEDVNKALRGEKTQFFLNGKKLAEFVNKKNTYQVDQLRALREAISKMEQTLLSDIAENKKKAEADEKAWIDSKLPVDVDITVPGNSHAVVTVTED